MEAIAHLTTGLELLTTIPQGTEQLEEELALRLAIGGPLNATRSEAAVDVERNYNRARALCEQLGRSAELFPVLRGLWNCYLVRGELQHVYDLAEQLVALATEQGTALHRALALRARGTTLFFLGRFADAAAALDEGIAIDDAVGDWENPAHLLQFTERAGVVCRMYSAWALWYRGFPDRAVETMEVALSLGQKLPDIRVLAFAMSWAAYLHNLRREFETAKMRAEAAIEIAGAYHFAGTLPEATVGRGYALIGAGQPSEVIAQIHKGLADWNDMGCHLLDALWLSYIAEAHIQAGQLNDALSTLDQASKAATLTGDCHYEAELHRLRGVALVKIGNATEGIACLQRAIDTSRSQQSKSLELRAATCLARLWAKQGSQSQARNLLAPVYDWFTEGFDTADLKDARTLLDELR